MLKGFKTRHLDHSSAAAMAVVWKTFSTGTSMENDFFHFVDGSILTCSFSCTRAYPVRFALSLFRQLFSLSVCPSVCPAGFLTPEMERG